MSKYKEIVIDKHVLNGNPYLKGTRLTVFDIVSDYKYDGIEIFLDSSETVSISDLQFVLKYCATRQCDKAGSHCGGCSLRPLQDGIHNEKDFINRFAEVRFSDSDKILQGSGEGIMMMSGTPEELHKTWRGEDGWVIASKLSEKLKVYLLESIKRDSMD